MPSQQFVRPAGRCPLVLTAFMGFVLAATAPVGAAADVREAIKRALPATVGVEQRDSSGTAKALTLATGAIVSADGLVVTMNDDFKNERFLVILSDGREVDGKLLVDDRRNGLKLLKIAADHPHFLTAFEPSPGIGEDVVVAYSENPAERAAARGMVAATNRELWDRWYGLLQIDANVGKMSAGAPVVDDDGRLRGIIVYQEERRGGSTFAVPASAVLALLHARRGESPVVLRRARFGVQYVESDKEMIAHPIDGGAAKAAGLREGDRMLAIDGVELKRHQDLTRVLSQRAAGDKVRLTVRRDGKEQAIDVTLRAVSDDEGQAAAQNPSPAPNLSLGLDLAQAPGWNVVNPGTVYLNLTTKDGQPQSGVGQILGTLVTPNTKGRNFDVERGTVPTIRVERSEMEQKLEQIGRDVLTLRQQMESLTDEMRRLQKQLSNDAGQRTGK